MQARTRGERFRSGAITGAKAALVIQIVFMLGNLYQGHPPAILPLLFAICIVGGGLIGMARR